MMSHFNGVTTIEVQNQFRKCIKTCITIYKLAKQKVEHLFPIILRFCFSGGCGAPLRDKGGVPIANLRKVTRDSKSPDKRDGYWSDKNGNNHRNSYNDDNEDSDNGRGDRGRRLSENGMAKNREKDDNLSQRRNSSSSNYGSPHHSDHGTGSYSDNCVSSPSGSFTSPKKFMGAIKHMNSSMGDKERDIKLR